MGEKTLLTLVILFLVVGAFAYDRYVTEKGEIGPVARLMDYAGLSERTADLFHHKKVTQMSAEYRIGDIYHVYQQIEKQRLDLMQHRQEILTQMQQMHHVIKEEAQQYAATLDQEQQSFLERFPELKKFFTQVQVSSNLPLEPKDREKQLMKIQEDLGIFLKTQMLLSDEKRIEVEQALKNLGQQNLNVQELLETAQFLDKEYQAFADNVDATKQQFDHNADQISMRFQQLTQKLVQVTDQDVMELMVLYQNLWEAEEMLLTNLELNQARIVQQQQVLQKKWRDTLEQSKLLSSGPAGIEGMLNSLDQEEAMLQKLAANQQQMRQNLVDRFLGLKDVGRALDVPVVTPGGAMVSAGTVDPIQGRVPSTGSISHMPNLDRRFSGGSENSAGSSSSPETSRGSANRFSSVQNRRLQTSVRRPASRSRVPSSSTDQQMQKLRDQARDQGFYDRAR